MFLSTVDVGIQPEDNFIVPLAFLSFFVWFLLKKNPSRCVIIDLPPVSEYFAFSIDFLVMAMKI